MRYAPFSLADYLEKADTLTNAVIMSALLDRQDDPIREMSHAEFKELRQDLFTFFYKRIAEEGVEGLKQAFKDYDPDRDGIENSPFKNFKPINEFEMHQEIKAYFEAQGMLH